MLSKLMYHEFKATRRVFFPAYGIMIALAVISSVFMILSSSLQRLAVPLTLLLVAYGLSLFAVGILSFVYMIVRFYKNLLCDEGYLMFTLPATPAQLIWSKCIVSTIWMVVSTILCIVTLGILLIPLMLGTVSTADASFWQSIHLGFQYIAQTCGIHAITFPILLIVLGIVYIANSCMHIYACLAVGGLFNKHRLGAAVIAFIVFAIVWNIILTTLLSISSKISNVFSWDPFSYSAFTNGLSASYLFVIGSIVVVIVCMLVNFCITNYIFKRHLNLQ
jgi:hypothetical protein